MTEDDNKRLQEFRTTREAYDMASFAARGENTPATKLAAIAVYKALDELHDLDDEGLRKLVEEALETWGTDASQIAQQLLMQSIQPAQKPN